MVIFGHSYRFNTIFRASAAHDSPRRKAGSELTLGCVENRAETAHTARMRTGGSVPALPIVKNIRNRRSEGCDLL